MQTMCLGVNELGQDFQCVCCVSAAASGEAGGAEFCVFGGEVGDCKDGVDVDCADEDEGFWWHGRVFAGFWGGMGR